MEHGRGDPEAQEAPGQTVERLGGRRALAAAAGSPGVAKSQVNYATVLVRTACRRQRYLVLRRSNGLTVRQVCRRVDELSDIPRHGVVFLAKARQYVSVKTEIGGELNGLWPTSRCW